MMTNYRFLLPLMMMIIILQSTLILTLDSSDEQLKQSNSETTATTSISTIDTDIERVKLSLNEIELLLNQAKQNDNGNDGGKQQFAELHRHIHIIKDQLNLIQEEYEMNKNLDHFLEQIQQWHIDAQTLGLRLKRDLQSFHH